MNLDAPLEAAVESSIVGYTTITMEAGKWYQVGCPFIELADAQTYKINDVFRSGFGAGDVLNILNKETVIYKSYYWRPQADNGQGAWCENQLTITPTTTELEATQAVFIKKKEVGEVIFSGKVSVELVTEFGSETQPSWQQICVVYPESVRLNNLTWSGLQKGDVLNVLNSDTVVYKSYYWNPMANNGIGAWCDNQLTTTPSEFILGPAQGLFINKKSIGKASCSL